MEIEQNEITTEAWLKHSSWGKHGATHYTSGRKQQRWSIKKLIGIQQLDKFMVYHKIFVPIPRGLLHQPDKPC